MWTIKKHQPKVKPTLQTAKQSRRYQDRDKHPTTIPGTWREVGVTVCQARNALDCVLRSECNCKEVAKALANQAMDNAASMAPPLELKTDGS